MFSSIFKKIKKIALYKKKIDYNYLFFDDIYIDYYECINYYKDESFFDIYMEYDDMSEFNVILNKENYTFISDFYNDSSSIWSNNNSPDYDETKYNKL